MKVLVLDRIHKRANEESHMKRLGDLTISQLLFITMAEANAFFVVTTPIQMFC